jgi:hypothetical protein
MTKIELKKASEPLSKYAQKVRKEPVIVVKTGKPFCGCRADPKRGRGDGISKHKPQVPGDHRTLAISHEKGRRYFLQRTSPPAWTKKIVRCHFDVLRIVKT